MDCYAAGWGKTRTADSTRQAHQTAITLISNETCENVYNIKYSKEEMVCTGGMNRPCQGDGGAPLVSSEFPDGDINNYLDLSVNDWRVVPSWYFNLWSWLWSKK